MPANCSGAWSWKASCRRNAACTGKIVDPQTGRSLGAGQQPASTSSLRWSNPATGVEPWSDRHPKLYRIEAELRSAAETLDIRSQPFGMRRLTASGMALRLKRLPDLPPRSL